MARRKQRLLISDAARAKRDASILKLRASGKTANEIANELKVKSFTVYNVLHAARQRGEHVPSRRGRGGRTPRSARSDVAPAFPRVTLSEIDRLRVENRILRSILANVPQVKELLAQIAA